MLDLYMRIISALRREEGQDLAEYALLLFLIALLVIAVLSPLGTAIANVFTQITARL